MFYNPGSYENWQLVPIGERRGAGDRGADFTAAREMCLAQLWKQFAQFLFLLRCAEIEGHTLTHTTSSSVSVTSTPIMGGAGPG